MLWRCFGCRYQQHTGCVWYLCSVSSPEVAMQQRRYHLNSVKEPWNDGIQRLRKRRCFTISILQTIKGAAGRYYCHRRVSFCPHRGLPSHNAIGQADPLPPPRRQTPLRRHIPSPPQNTLYWRAVRILLECILVYLIYFSVYETKLNRHFYYAF